MKPQNSLLGLILFGCALSLPAQRIGLGVAPTYDGGGDELGPAVVQHLTVDVYKDLNDSKQFAPTLLNPGGVFTPLDTSWLSEYVQDRPDLDLLLVTTLKPTLADKTGSTIAVDVVLLDAKTGAQRAEWTVSETTKTKNAWVDQGQSMITNAVNQRGSQYGFEVAASPNFEKQPIGKTTAHLAEQIRDTLPAHLSGFTRTAAEKPVPASGTASCPMHMRITYNYKHVASHSYTVLANGLDQSLAVTDGIGTFTEPEGPLLLQFAINDTPYKLSKQPIYQLSTIHSCSATTLVVDIGQGGDAHETWQ